MLFTGDPHRIRIAVMHVAQQPPKRGRPKGALDTKRRKRRGAILPSPVLPSLTPIIAAGINTVRDRLQQLEHPVPPSEIARITGISKATLIRRCNEGSLPHFRSRGMILLDPAVVLEWYMRRWVPLGQQSVYLSLSRARAIRPGRKKQPAASARESLSASL